MPTVSVSVDVVKTVVGVGATLIGCSFVNLYMSLSKMPTEL